MKDALDLLKRQPFAWDQAGSFQLYGWYYTTLAMFQGGGEYWNTWIRQLRDPLIAAQMPDGHWPPPPGSKNEKAFTATPVYSTALATMILETDYRYQPQYLKTKKAG